jgi:hypothetical protein
MGEENEPQSEQQPTGSDLRSQLEAAIATNKTLTANTQAMAAELANLKTDKLFNDAGLGHLSEDHRTALKAVAGNELTIDLLKDKAGALGFNKTEEPKPPAGETLPPPQGAVDADLLLLSQINAATDAKPASGSGDVYYDQLRAAKSQEEILEVIRKDGGRHGQLDAGIYE